MSEPFSFYGIYFFRFSIGCFNYLFKPFLKYMYYLIVSMIIINDVLNKIYYHIGCSNHKRLLATKEKQGLLATFRK